MRYLIIDMEKIRDGSCKMKNHDGGDALNLDKAILSEEESLAKFKEVWRAGVESGTSNTPLEKNFKFNDLKDIIVDWNSLKEQL